MDKAKKMEIAIRNFAKEVDKIGIDKNNPEIGYVMFFKCGSTTGVSCAASVSDSVNIMANSYFSNSEMACVLDNVFNFIEEIKQKGIKPISNN